MSYEEYLENGATPGGIAEIETNELHQLEAQKPCPKCGVNIEEAILWDEVSCYMHCKKWHDWVVRKVALQQKYAYGEIE